MNKLTRLLTWILKAAVFFALFAFALNNQQDATVHLLFGHQWRAPMMLIVLAAFALGLVVGVLGMLPAYLTEAWGVELSTAGTITGITSAATILTSASWIIWFENSKTKTRSI